MTYTPEQRLAHMRQFVAHAAKNNKLSAIRPGYVAATYSGGTFTKDDVKAEIASHEEVRA